MKGIHIHRVLRQVDGADGAPKANSGCFVSCPFSTHPPSPQVRRLVQAHHCIVTLVPG